MSANWISTNHLRFLVKYQEFLGKRKGSFFLFQEILQIVFKALTPVGILIRRYLQVFCK